jgi:hypothetical protein
MWYLLLYTDKVYFKKILKIVCGYVNKNVYCFKTGEEKIRSIFNFQVKFINSFANTSKNIYVS